MEKLRPNEREQEYNDCINMHGMKDLRQWEEKQIDWERDGMFDGYEKKLPLMPDNEFYMKGYNSVK